MAELSVTLIDVGWGDSILVDSSDDAGNRAFGLVDCNDYERQRTALPGSCSLTDMPTMPGG
jgi:hypothetical protein